MTPKKADTCKRRRKSRALGKETVDKLLSAPETQREKVMISLFINTGMRRSDIAEMRVSDINMVENSILVPSQRKTGKMAYLTIPKNLASNLKIYINEHLKKNSDWLFPSPKFKGKPIADRTVSDIFTKVCELIDLKNVTPHDLRATFLTNAGKHGIPPKMIVEALGISYNTVMRYYQHFTLEDKREAFSKIQTE